MVVGGNRCYRKLLVKPSLRAESMLPHLWGSCHEDPPQKLRFGGGGLRSKTEGAAMQSIAVEGADCVAVGSVAESKTKSIQTPFYKGGCLRSRQGDF